MKTYFIELDGYVVAKPRPRVTRNGTFTPPTAREAEYRLRQQWQEKKNPMLEGPVAVQVAVFIDRPRGHYGARGLRPSAPRHPTTRPDVDNYAKTALDALNGVAFKDDSQVVELTARKRYATEFQPAGWAVTIQEVGS